MGAKMMPSPNAAIAVPCFLGGKVSSSTAWDKGCRPPPVRPCRTRKKISHSRLVAMPQSSDVKVKPVTQVISTRRRPKRLASQPDIGRMTAFDTRYEVTTHVPSSTVAPTFPAMCGMETFTTVVSRISMNVPSMTAMVTIQGLTGLSAFSAILLSHNCRKARSPKDVTENTGERYRGISDGDESSIGG